MFGMTRKQFIDISKTTLHKWQANNATLRAAALAFFTILPLPSLLLILIEIFTLIYGQAAALQQLILQVDIIAGPTIADLVGELVGNSANPLTNSFGSFITVIFAIVGAIGAFAVLQDTLNGIWEVPHQEHRSLKVRLRERIVPFLMVSLAGIIVVAWTGITNVLFLSLGFILGSKASLVIGGVQIVLSFGLTAVLFAIIYRQMPDTEIDWRDVIWASIITSLVSTALDYLFGIYIHTFPATSLIGTAGAVMILMLWIFVTDEFILFGAQFSKTYAETLGSRSKDSYHI